MLCVKVVEDDDVVNVVLMFQSFEDVVELMRHSENCVDDDVKHVSVDLTYIVPKLEGVDEFLLDSRECVKLIDEFRSLYDTFVAFNAFGYITGIASNSSHIFIFHKNGC